MSMNATRTLLAQFNCVTGDDGVGALSSNMCAVFDDGKIHRNQKGSSLFQQFDKIFVLLLIAVGFFDSSSQPFEQDLITPYLVLTCVDLIDEIWYLVGMPCFLCVCIST